MGKTQAVQSVNTPTPEDSELSEIADYIEGRIADMETAADAGDPIAIGALANGYAERLRRETEF